MMHPSTRSVPSEYYLEVFPEKLLEGLHACAQVTAAEGSDAGHKAVILTVHAAEHFPDAFFKKNMPAPIAQGAHVRNRTILLIVDNFGRCSPHVRRQRPAH